MAHKGDPVFNEKGKLIGTVTSCAIDSQEYLTGQALLDTGYINEGTPIFIYQNTAQMSEFNLSNLKSGDRIPLPSRAFVIARFPHL
jgi:glycine hydroxymethyltransferase